MDTNNLKDAMDKFEENLDKITNLTKAKFTKGLNREDTILVVIDVQEKLAPAMRGNIKAIKNTNILLKVGKELDIPVIVTEQYPRGLGTTIDIIQENFTGDTRVFEKTTFSAMRTEEIKEYVEKLNKPNLVVMGMETHICVYQTVKDLLLGGYNVYVARDAVASRTEENLENGLDLMKSYGAKISNVETIMFELLEKAGTEEFKSLSPLIK